MSGRARMNYYNDNDPKACAWLRELIAERLIPPGDVDSRSILEVCGADLEGYAQCHFFAGIGGWSRALELAGWGDREVWTGSCPCQPLSCAGKRVGHADSRHLWPAFFNLISECRPATIFGEQVAGKDGREWVSGVRADLEGAGYACGIADLCACGAGAPHIRQRLYWVADANFGRRAARDCETRSPETALLTRQSSGRMADSEDSDRGSRERREEAGVRENGEWRGRLAGGSAAGGMGNAASGGWERSNGTSEQEQGSGQGCVVGRVGNAPSGGCRERGDEAQPGSSGHTQRAGGTGLEGMGDSGESGLEKRGSNGPVQSEALGTSEGQGTIGANFWANSVLIECRDGKARRVEPGIFPLADGVPGRVGLLRGAGNAIIPQVAAEFISAFLQIKLTTCAT